jgi:hypothetical protein
VVDRGRSREASGVGGSSERNHLFLIVSEEHINIDTTFGFHLVLNEVLTVVMVTDLARDVSSVLVFNDNLKGVTARSSVLTFVITSLDHELNRLSDGLVFQNTGTESKRLSGTSVQEVVVGDICSCKLISEDG